MAFSYGSKNSALSSRRLIIALIIALTAASFFIAGLAARPAFASYSDKQLSKTCETYVKLVLRGDLDEAYDRSAVTIKDVQSISAYKQALEKIKSDQPVFNKKASTTEIIDSKSAACVINVDGLSAEKDQRTDAVFKMAAVKDGRQWKVASLSVE